MQGPGSNMVTTLVALGVTVATLAVFALLGIWYSRGRVESVEDLVTARNTAGGGATTATLIASGMGAWILFSPAEAGAAFGGIAAVAGYAIGSALPMLAYIFVGPRIRELLPDGHGITEYARTRYGSRMHGYVALVTVFYMFIFLAAEMTGIAGALSLIADVPLWWTAGLVGAFVLVYTVYGGLKASIFTDTLQTLVILPLLGLGFAGAIWALGGTGQIHAQVTGTAPTLLEPGLASGLEFGVYVAFAILGAEMLNQAWWQRIYASDDSSTLRRSFGVAAVAVWPMIVLAGLFGVVAQGMGLVGADGSASVAFFLVVLEAFPPWLVLGIVLLAVLLVMSTADTLINAIASVASSDLPHLTDVDDTALTRITRGLTVVVAVGATVIGARGWSVLELFLVADLLAAATFVPLLAGLWSRRLSGGGAVAASMAGLLVGVTWFPTLRAPLAAVGLQGVLPDASFLVAFLGAVVVSTIGTFVLARLAGRPHDLDALADRARRLDDGPGPAPRPDGVDAE